jgi:hypothetical protein
MPNSLHKILAFIFLEVPMFVKKDKYYFESCSEVHILS